MRIACIAAVLVLVACANRSSTSSPEPEPEPEAQTQPQPQADPGSNEVAAPASDETTDAAAYDRLIVVARLVERPFAPVPHCGYLHVAEVMRYEVVETLLGPANLSSLWVAHGCPEIGSFAIGAEYRLELSLPTPGTAGQPSAIGGEQRSYWWADRTDAVGIPTAP